MKYEFKSIAVEEVSFKLNRVRIEAENGRLDIKPQFSRQVRKPTDRSDFCLVALSVRIESTEDQPKPFDLAVTIVGRFDTPDVKGDRDERAFVKEATNVLYPYLRSYVTNLTAGAYIAPLNLPVINGPIFPEDRDSYAFTADDSSLN